MNALEKLLATIAPYISIGENGTVYHTHQSVGSSGKNIRHITMDKKGLMYICPKCAAKMPVGTVVKQLRSQKSADILAEIQASAKKFSDRHDAMLKTEKDVRVAVATEALGLSDADINALSSGVYFHKATSVAALAEEIRGTYDHGSPLRDITNVKRRAIFDYFQTAGLTSKG